jgi:electron transport complex protein RnfD
MTFVADRASVARIMYQVLAALLPPLAAYVWYFGPAILVQIALASAAALGAEALMLRLRRVPVAPFLRDGSALATAWLIALSFPPLAPWWLTVSATAFAIVFAKQLYGGLGNNLFNPAMAAYAVAIISFPLQMTHWSAPAGLAQAPLGFAGQLNYIFAGALPPGLTLDAVTLATPLDTVKTQLHLGRSVEEAMRLPLFGAIGGASGEVIALCYLFGGLYLWQRRIITWHIPAAFLGVVALCAGALHLVDSARYAPPWLHLAGGASMIGAFFILTDPVSSPSTPRGKLIYAGGAGALTYVIRVFGGYPDGVAFATLLMNMAAPLIELYTQDPVFGQRRAADREHRP